MLTFKQTHIVLVVFAMLSSTLTHARQIVAESRQIKSFDSAWKFCAGEIKGAEQPEYNDASWRTVDVPHDWSIAGLAHSEANIDSATELPVVKGEWKFKGGDDALWKNPGLDDASWQSVKLPAPWEEHSNYTADNVVGWFRRELTVPADLQGKDLFINVGKIDDADETYFNGVKVGGLGQFPPHYTTAWDIIRRYKVPHELIHYGGKNTIAVRVFDGVQGGGIYDEGAKITEGIFESSSPAGSGGGISTRARGGTEKSSSFPEMSKASASSSNSTACIWTATCGLTACTSATGRTAIPAFSMN